MTSSDQTELAPGAVAERAARVAATVDAGPDPVARVGLVCARFNGGITARLLDGALDALDEHGLGASSASVAWVPGAFELPLAARAMIGSGSIDAVVALGAVIRGDTAHFDFVAGECAHGLARVGLDAGVPVVFGVLTTDTVEQALERSRPGVANKGYEAAMGALEMVTVLDRLGAAAPAAGPEGG